MKNFDQRWRRAVDEARHATVPEESAPYGFAQRIVARARSQERQDMSYLSERVVVRWIVGMTVVLLFCVAAEYRHLRGPTTLQTGIENTVAQLVWSL